MNISIFGQKSNNGHFETCSNLLFPRASLEGDGTVSTSLITQVCVNDASSSKAYENARET